MSNDPTWPETESSVFHPALWAGGLIATFLLAFGAFGFAVIGSELPPESTDAFWAGSLMSGLSALIGAVALAVVITQVLRPIRIRHAVAGILADIPSGPVIREDSVVHVRLSHELVENEQGWELRPRTTAGRLVERIFWICAIPFLIGGPVVLIWQLHESLGWVVAAVCGILAALGAVTGLAIFMTILQLNHHQLLRLCIPSNGDDLRLYSYEPLNYGSQIKAVAEVSIPWSQLVCIQLCPWKFVIHGTEGDSATWAVQGLLVLTASPGSEYRRLPILLTSNFPGAARLMGQLANTLHVPYLYYADAAGWRAEESRARRRAPLTRGAFSV